jgi:RNA recognition motif-containing protein
MRVLCTCLEMLLYVCIIYACLCTRTHIHTHTHTYIRAGKLRGFGFVEFKDEIAAKKAVESSGIVVNGRQVRVAYAPEKRESGDSESRMCV